MRIARVLLALAPAIVLTVGGCGRSEPTASKEEPAATTVADQPGEVVARVNGAPIYRAEVELAIGAGGHGGAPGDRAPWSAVVDGLVHKELVYQRAVQMGLDEDPGYRNSLEAINAKAAVARREAMSQVFFREAIASKATPTDAEARAYYKEHGELLGTELHVWQILLRRNRETADAVLQEIRGGAPFEQVAARQYDRLPPGRPPWDLGYLRYLQLPEPWRDAVLELEPGQVSEVIEGEGRRFWIVKLIDRRQVADASFESLAPMIVNALKGDKLASVRKQIESELRQGAQIEILDASGPSVDD